MSISISKQTDKVRFLTGNTTVVTRVYQQAKQKNSCQAFKNRLLHKRSISELHQSKIEVIPIQTIKEPQQLSVTQSSSNLLTDSQVNFQHNSLMEELRKQLTIKDKKIAQLNAVIHQKTDQIAREKNNSFLTSRLHGKQIVTYEERINEYEKKISQLIRSKQTQQGQESKEMTQQISKLKVQKQGLQKEIQNWKQKIERQRKQWSDQKQKMIAQHVKQMQGKSQEIINLQMRVNQLSVQNKKYIEQKEKTTQQLIDSKNRIDTLQSTIKALNQKKSDEQYKASHTQFQQSEQKQQRYMLMQIQYKRVTDEMLAIKQQLTKMNEIKQQLKNKQQKIQTLKQQHQYRIKQQELIQQELACANEQLKHYKLLLQQSVEQQSVLISKVQLIKEKQQQNKKLRLLYNEIQEKYFQLLEEFNLEIKRVENNSGRELNKVKQVIVSKDKQIQQMEQRMIEMQRQLQIKSRFSQQSISKIQQLTRSIQDKQVQIKQITLANSRLVEQNKRLNQRIKQYQQKVRASKDQVSRLISNIQNMNNKIKCLQHHILQLNQQKVKQTISQSIITTVKLHKLQQQVIQKQQQINQLKKQLNQKIKQNFLLQQNLLQEKLKIQSIQVNLKRVQHLNALLSNENKILHQQLDALQNTTVYLKKQVTTTLQTHQNSLKQIALLKQSSQQQQKQNKRFRTRGSYYPYTSRVSYTNGRSKFYQNDHRDVRCYQTDRKNHNSPYSPYRDQYNSNTYDNFEHQPFINNNNYCENKIYRSASFIDTHTPDRHKRSSSNNRLDQQFIQNMNLSAVSLDFQLNKNNISLKNNHRRTQTEPIEPIDEEGSQHQLHNNNSNNRTICERGRLLHKISGVSSIMLGSEQQKFQLERDMTRSKDTFEYDKFIQPYSCESQNQSGEVSFSKQS